MNLWKTLKNRLKVRTCNWTPCGLNKDGYCLLEDFEKIKLCREHLEQWGRGEYI